MTVQRTQLKQIATEVVGTVASGVLMNRIAATLEESADAKSAATKVGKLVALFLGPDHAQVLERRFNAVLG